MALYIIYKLFMHCFFKLNLFKNCIKDHEINLQQFPAIVTNISEFFCATLQTSYGCILIIICLLHVYEHGKKVCQFHYIKCSLNMLKSPFKKFSSQAVRNFPWFSPKLALIQVRIIQKDPHGGHSTYNSRSHKRTIGLKPTTIITTFIDRNS